MESLNTHQTLTRGNKFQGSFREFSKDYMIHSSDGKYKSTSLFKTLVGQQKSDELIKNSLFRYEPNSSTHGNTWDAKHLDKFLNQSQWSRGLNTLSIDPGRLNTSQKKKLEASLKDEEVKMKQSFFFTHERMEDNNVIKDFSQKMPENRYNQLAIDAPRKVDQAYLNNYYDKNFRRLEKSFDPSKLYFQSHSTTLFPSSQRIELEELKKQRELYSEWKEHNKNITKKYRILKNTFCSGIIGFDNPLCDDTYIFKEEHDNLQKILHEKKIIQDRYRNQILDNSKTNPEIVFHNKWAKELDDPLKQKELLKKPLLPANTRKKVEDPEIKKYSDTHSRLFGDKVEKYSLNRAAFLRNQELKGKDYNITSGVINNVELKVDQGRATTNNQFSLIQHISL